MKASCCEVETSWDRLLLVVSNHLTSRATIHSSCHTALRVTTYSMLNLGWNSWIYTQFEQYFRPGQIGYHSNEFTPILSSISCPVKFQIWLVEFNRPWNTAQIGLKFTEIIFVCLPDRIGYHSNEFTPILSSISCPVKFQIRPVEFDRPWNTAQIGLKFTEIIFVCLPDQIGYHSNEFTPILSSISCPVKFDRSNLKFDQAWNIGKNGCKFIVSLPGWIGYHLYEFTPNLSSISCPVELGIIPMNLLPFWAVFHAWSNLKFDRSNLTGHEILLKLGWNSLRLYLYACLIELGIIPMNLLPFWAVFHARSNFKFDRSNSTGHEILLKMGVNSLEWYPIRPGLKYCSNWV